MIMKANVFFEIYFQVDNFDSVVGVHKMFTFVSNKTEIGTVY